ncbi:hypothetical protein SEA_ANNADREAMY_32 [Streptomyces phage Annadreamy]|uniref:Tail terminator n=2 Tax=Annadreamyvirus annadreamy TaxID=2846392 RepID=A0A345GT81_9CAUD|nr:hypothetical protein HWB75_gp214 [Streptomyces phage Annadreamy]AXG66153.1 hypothetical protein SEA_ANNADREAMY_32 [Streptomyces phage Annadreamy]QGH79365.1 hypothetical protein SEA_LIMPID_32 [Streptomyces phage Limpid]
MADYRTVGAHQINKWLWSKLKTYEYKPGVKAFADYKDSGNPTGYAVTPIIPNFQTAQITTITKNQSPYIVYNYVQNPYDSEWWMCREQCAYMIYDGNEERLRGIQNYMADLLKRMDWTARDLNYSGTVASNFDFKYVRLVATSGPDDLGEEVEDVNPAAMVVINYEYTVDMNTAEGNGMRV